MKYKTELFNRVSPDYPKIDEKFVDLFWQNKGEIEIPHDLSREELEDFETYLSDASEIKNIKFKEGVSLSTITSVNDLIKKTGKHKPLQELNRPFTPDEIKELMNNEDFDEESLIASELLSGSQASLKEYKEYEAFKRPLLDSIRELELSPLESSAYIYGYIRDGFKINNESATTVYQTVLTGNGSNESINLLLCDLLRSAGIECAFNNMDGIYTVGVQINDEKYDQKGTFNLDVLTDMNISAVVDADNLYTKFMEGVDKETITKVVTTLNRKLKILESVIEEEQPSKNKGSKASDKKSEKPNEIPVITDDTLTFAIPVDEIRAASVDYAMKSAIDTGISTCQSFLDDEMITDEDSFGEFLVRNGASEEIVKNIVSSNTTNYYATLDSKKGARISYKKGTSNASLYVPTTENDNHSMRVNINSDGSITTINSEYSDFMESGIRYGSTSVLVFSQNEDKTVRIDEHLSKISPVSEITPEMIMPVYDVSVKSQVFKYDGGKIDSESADAVGVVCTLENNKLVSSNIDESEKMTKARSLGFDEKYYTKKQIAGLNKYSDGTEKYVTEEDLNDEMDESGLVQTDEMVLVKTSGKANILLISAIVGFVIGLGIGIAVLILNIG